MCSIVDQLPITDERFIELCEKTKVDQTLQTVSDLVTQGWPSREYIPDEAKPSYTFHDKITYCNGLLFRGNQVIIPKTLQPEMFKKIHASHQGIVKSKQRAKSVRFWPGMNSQIEDVVSKCTICIASRTYRPAEPLNPRELPHRPWSKVGADLFEIGSQYYLMIVDYCLKFPEVVTFANKTAHTVVRACKSVFARLGTPDVLISDNGPCFDSELFREFARSWEFKHTTTRPGYPQSNCLVENAVKSVKRLL